MYNLKLKNYFINDYQKENIYLLSTPALKAFNDSCNLHSVTVTWQSVLVYGRMMYTNYCPLIWCYQHRAPVYVDIQYTQRRVQPDQCYFTVPITDSNFECSLQCNSIVIVCTFILLVYYMIGNMTVKLPCIRPYFSYIILCY